MGIKIAIKLLLVLSWIIFVGLCIEAGGFLTNAIFALANPGIVTHLWREVDLSGLFRVDHQYFFIVTLLMSIVSALKAWLFYRIIKMLHDKDLDLSQPFSSKIRRFVLHLSYIAFIIGIFCWSGVRYTGWLVEQGVTMPDTQYLQLGGADVWIFMGIVLLVVAQVFKRGIVLQSENDLTI